MIKQIQEILKIPITGQFDEFTEAAVRNFQLRNSLIPTGILDNETKEKIMPDANAGFISTDLSEVNNPPKPNELKPEFPIKKIPLKKGNYFAGPTKKEYLFLHFTAGWDNPYNVIKDWENDKRGEVCTQFVVGGRNFQTLEDKYDGEIVQCLEYENYGWHLGIGNTAMHRNSIGIEICNAGL